MKRKADKINKFCYLYFVSDDFFAVTKRHHSFMLFLAHYISYRGNKIVLDAELCEYLINSLKVKRTMILRHFREVTEAGALKKVGNVTYYMHPDIFYRGRASERMKLFNMCGFENIDKVIERYKRLNEGYKKKNGVLSKKPKLGVVKKINV